MLNETVTRHIWQAFCYVKCVSEGLQGFGLRVYSDPLDFSLEGSTQSLHLLSHLLQNPMPQKLEMILNICILKTFTLLEMEALYSN